MAQTTLIPPDNHTKLPTTRDENAEAGWSFKRIVDALNTMLTEVYGVTDAIVAGTTEQDVGAAGAGVTAEEFGNALTHQSVLTLDALEITLTDDAGAGQYGTLPLYEFPAGNIMVLGAVIDAEITLNETWWVDNIPGDVGIGTAAVANGDALATTEQDILATTPIAALVAQVGPIDAQSVAALTTAAAGTDDAIAHLNVRIDDNAAHMPTVVTNGTFGADTDWTKGTGWTIAAGVANCDGSQVAVSDLSQVATLVDGVTYKLTFTMTRSAGTITPLVGGTAGTVRSSANTFVEDIVAGAADTLAFRADADFVGTIDTVVLTPLTGTGEITGTVTLTWVNLGDIA